MNLFSAVLQFIFPTTCLHCDKKTEGFSLCLCSSCLQQGISAEAVWQDKYWTALEKESPLVSLWLFGKNKKYSKPIKNLAAVIAARWAASEQPLPDIVSFISTKDDALRKDQSLQQFAVELAKFFSVQCEKFGEWKIDGKVFDAKGGIVANWVTWSKTKSFQGKRCLFVCENEQKHEVEIFQEQGLQDVWVLQLIE